ncbi:nucleoside hydrolase [Novosphingobium sp. TH158]|uniref:nucleoside hydrolase n=1 Tax=Novosphingobium sp. TH158 TaxID=2067455 RepID=UPI000C7DD268|nr:nucleoside hydrolase [Novosphingobium sp. TH158]PLK27618.1 twin-arginine translocation pathway signal protein [Novosphingobium sp. TH158]
MPVNRRSLIAGAATLAGTAFAAPLAAKVKPFAPYYGPRSRVVYVNDLAGDIDGLFATAHMALSKTSELRTIVGSGFTGPHESADHSTRLGREMMALMGVKVPVVAGCAKAIGKDRTPQASPGVQAIIDEAMRTDSALPLYVAVGGGLSEVASAILLEPKIAERMTLIWIGGGSMPAGVAHEANFNIDPDAARFIFNDAKVPMWTIPQAVYSTCIVSATELQARVAPHGKIGKWLYGKLVSAPADMSRNLSPDLKFKFNAGETWILGDSPLAVLTSLTDWVPNFDFPTRTVSWDRTSAGHYDEVPCPLMNADGTFTPRSDGRKVRIYRDIDTRLMFGDFFAKLELNYPAR